MPYYSGVIEPRHLPSRVQGADSYMNMGNYASYTKDFVYEGQTITLQFVTYIYGDFIPYDPSFASVYDRTLGPYHLVST